MFNIRNKIRKKISHYRRLIRFKVRLLRSNGDSLWHSANRSRARHERAISRKKVPRYTLAQIHSMETPQEKEFWNGFFREGTKSHNKYSSRKTTPSVNFFGKRKTHTHKAYRRSHSKRYQAYKSLGYPTFSSSSQRWY